VIAIRDRKGRLWVGRLTLGSARRVRDLAGLDVMALVTDGGETDARLSRELGLAVDALFALFLPECAGDRMTAYRFGKRFRGVRSKAIADAIREEVGDFFRVPGPPAPKGGSGRTATAAELWQDAERMAGLVGADPDRSTFGELVAACEGRRRHDWAQTATVLSYLSGLCGKAVSPASLDPTGGLAEASRSKGMAVTGDNLAVAALMLMGG
jgi:hypothetical protein